MTGMRHAYRPARPPLFILKRVGFFAPNMLKNIEKLHIFGKLTKKL